VAGIVVPFCAEVIIIVAFVLQGCSLCHLASFMSKRNYFGFGFKDIEFHIVFQ
jgi:hypothetical protein